MKYDYLENMKEDIKEYINSNFDTCDYTKEDLQTRLYDELWCEDSVTGNASGSYTFNSYKARENLYNNEYLLEEALSEFGYNELPLDKINAYEWQDVTIRCYLLSQAIEEVMKELYY